MKTVLITGATGAIGSALVPLFLQEPDTGVRLLLRANSEEHLRLRLNQLFQFWEVERGDRKIAERVKVLRGDVCSPLLGLDEQDYRKLAAEVTHVTHAAGNVKLNQTLAEARRNTLDATRNIVTFVQACRRGNRFQKLDLVSTVGVAGRTQGLIREEPRGLQSEFHNTYEAAKAESEAYVLEAIQQGLPATIHRPSMVVGDSREGKIIHFQVFYHLSDFLTGSRTWGIVPRMGRLKLDIIPVDYVARAIYVASGRQETAGRIFHLCSGPEHALPLVDITAQLRDLMSKRGRSLPPMRPVSLGWFRALLPLASWIVPRQMRRGFQGLHFFLGYLDEQQVFDNTQARTFLGQGGPAIPDVAQYLPKVMEYYWASKK